jgi:hypothetical protein
MIRYMKKSILVIACVTLSLAVFVSRGLAGPGPAAEKEKAVVDKVLKAENFTPSVAIEGPTNFVWFVAVRSFGTNSIEQVLVRVHGQEAKVQRAMYRRTAQGWQPVQMPASLETELQSKIQNEFVREK